MAGFYKSYPGTIPEIFDDRVRKQESDVLSHLSNRSLYFAKVSLIEDHTDNVTFVGTLNMPLSCPVLEAKTLLCSPGEPLEFMCVSERELQQKTITKRHKLLHKVEDEKFVRATIPKSCFANGRVVLYFALPESNNIVIGKPSSVSLQNTDHVIYSGNKYMTELGTSLFSYEDQSAPIPNLKVLKNTTGRPALHAAAMFNYPELCLYLLCQGYDVSARDFAFRTCWQVASMLNHVELANYLRTVATTINTKANLFVPRYAMMLLDCMVNGSINLIRFKKQFLAYEQLQNQASSDEHSGSWVIFCTNLDEIYVCK